MDHKFTEVSVESLIMNPFTKIGTQWMLITSGNMDNYKTRDYHKMYIGEITKVLSLNK